MNDFSEHDEFTPEEEPSNLAKGIFVVLVIYVVCMVIGAGGCYLLRSIT